MESKMRGFVVLIAVAATMLMLFAGQCQSAPSADAKSSRKGHKMNLGVCNPLCFYQCAVNKGDMFCYGKCLMECAAVFNGKPDPNNPRDICFISCAVPGCASLCTKEHPFPVEKVQTCLQTCSDNCDDIKPDN